MARAQARHPCRRNGGRSEKKAVWPTDAWSTWISGQQLDRNWQLETCPMREPPFLVAQKQLAMFARAMGCSELQCVVREEEDTNCCAAPTERE